MIFESRHRNEVGADLIMQIVSKAHRAEQEIYNLVAEIKGCTVKDAEQVDLSRKVDQGCFILSNARYEWIFSNLRSGKRAANR